MRDGTAVGGASRKSEFKSKLLIGAAGLAAASAGTAAAAPAANAPADDAKWLPWVSVGGQVGDHMSGGKLDVFLPVLQDLDSLMFVRLGVGTQTRDDEVANFGLGYRKRVSTDWIVGAYGGFDSSQTDYSNQFWQGSLGAELMSADWDARINAYLALENQAKVVAGKYALYQQDTRIAILQGQEGAYSGVDGEVGYRVFSTDNVDVRVFAGGYNFSRDDSTSTSMGRSFDIGYPTISGPMGRAEVDVYDIDAIGTQSRITVTGQIMHDNVRGTTGYVGASLRIPLGASWGEGGQALDELDRRMADPVRRQDNVLTEWEYSKPEPVIIYNGQLRSKPTNTVIYADNTAGAGSYADPTTLQDATSRDTRNAFIVATDFDGPITASGATLHSGQTLAGPGTYKVRGVDSHTVFSHDFAPGSGTPTLVASSASADVIALQSNSSIWGVDISGPFRAAIYGKNVSNIEIDDVVIDASQGQYGILLDQTQSQDLNVQISNSTIAGAGVDGVAVNTNVSDGGTSNQTIAITGSTISGSGAADVALTTTVGGGSTVDQDVSIDPTVISGGAYGFSIYDLANGGTLNQSVSLSQVTFTGQSEDGVRIDAVASGGGTIDQAISLDQVSVSGSGKDGIELLGSAQSGGTVSQQGSWTNVTANGASGALPDGSGILISGQATGGGTMLQSFDIAGLTANGNTFAGLGVEGVAGDYSNLETGGIVAQYISVHDAAMSGNAIGLFASSYAFGEGTARLDLTLTHSTLDSNKFGLAALAVASLDGSVQQNLVIAHDSFDSNSYAGAYIAAVGSSGGFAAQSVYIDDASFSGNGADGLDLFAAGVSGGDAEQFAGIYFSKFSGNGGNGLYVGTVAGGYEFGTNYVYYGNVSQTVIAYRDKFNRNHLNGIYIHNYVGIGGELKQYTYVGHSGMDHNRRNGILEVSKAIGYGADYEATAYLFSDLTVSASTADYNHYSGIYVYSDAIGPTYARQHVNVGHTEANGNSGYGGFGDVAYAEGSASLNIQYATLAYSTFDHNKETGAGFTASQTYGVGSPGATIQRVTIAGSDFSNNGTNGLTGYVDAYGYQGRAEQYFHISGSTFDRNAEDGIHLFRSAQDGKYLSGEACYVNHQSTTGGCAVARQQVYLLHSDVSHNGGDGIYIGTLAQNYAAVYDAYGRPHSPTLVLYDTTVNHNGGDGLHLYNHVAGASYLLQSVYLIDSTFNDNGKLGIEVQNYVSGASQLLQLLVMYSYAAPLKATADGNASGGIQIATQFDGGYYVASSAQTVLQMRSVDVSYNAGNGVAMTSLSTGGFAETQALLASYSSFVGNAGYGITLLDEGVGDYGHQQIVLADRSLFANNTLIGLAAVQTDLHSIVAYQGVVAAYDSFIDNAMGAAALSILNGTHSGKQSVAFVGNYFTGGDTSLGSRAGDAASVQFYADDVYAGIAVQAIVGNNFANVARDAVAVVVSASDHAYVYNYTAIAGNAINGAGGDGINLELSASNALLASNPNYGTTGAYGTTGVLITGNQVHGAAADGIYVKLSADSLGGILSVPGATTTSTYVPPVAFYVDVMNNTVGNVGGNGIKVATDNNQSYLISIVEAGGNTVSDAAGYGIQIANANSGGVTLQAELITGNTVSGAYVGGIAVNDHSLDGGLTAVLSLIGGNTVSSSTVYAGIDLVDYDQSSYLLHLSYVAGNTVSNSHAGIGMYTYGDDTGGQLTEVSGNTLSDNTYGIVAIANDTSIQYIQTYGLNTQTGTPPANYYHFHADPGATQIVN